MKRKIYNKLLEWKEKSAGKTALLIDGARRVGKSYIAEQFGKQVIMVTHAKDTAKYGNKIIHVALNEAGVSEANELDLGMS